MFPSHLIGPVARIAYEDPLSAVNHERRLALAAAQETSPGTRSGATAPIRALNRVVHAVRSLRTTGVFGPGLPSRPQ